MIQLVDFFCNGNALIMEYHGDDIEGAAIIILSEIAGFINKNAEFFRSKHTPHEIKKARNFPASDGPGSFDQPQSVFLLTLSII